MRKAFAMTTVMLFCVALMNFLVDDMLMFAIELVFAIISLVFYLMEE